MCAKIVGKTGARTRTILKTLKYNLSNRMCAAYKSSFDISYTKEQEKEYYKSLNGYFHFH